MTMTTATIERSIKTAKSALTDCKALKSSANYNPSMADRIFFKDSQDLIKAYGIYTTKYQYNFLLFDHSLIIFDYTNTDYQNLKLSYSYISNPNNFISYESYLAQFDFEYEHAKEELRSEYEQFLVEQEETRNPLYLRYDLSIEHHTSGLHPASHLHVGLENEIRIPIKKILTPKIFSLFILKQIYPENWRALISSDSLVKKYVKPSKSNCTELPRDKFTTLDELELYLS